MTESASSTGERRRPSLRRWLVVGLLAALAWAAWFLVPSPKPPPPPEVPRALLTLREGRLYPTGATSLFTGWMFETNAHGGLLSRSFVSNGILEGISEGFHTNGQRQVLEHFRAGVSHGPRTKWHANGNKASETTVVDGQLEGLFLRWSENGSLAEEISMRHGQAHGLSRSFYPSGFLKAEVRMEDGKPVEQRFWKDGEQSVPPHRTAPPATGPSAPERKAAWHPEILTRLDGVITEAIAAGKSPGAVLWLEHRGEVYQKAFGQRALRPAAEPMTLDTVFDVASLTKAIATAPAVMRLIERGALGLDDPVPQHLPEFRGPGAAAVTVRHLLTHTSGLVVGISGVEFTNYAGALTAAFRERPRSAPGTEFHYCDLNFILLGEIVQRVARQPLDEFVAREIFGPLRMTDTRYRPPADGLSRIAPTQALPSGLLRGEVHDSTARRMGGVAGHAGVFATASDLARFARMMLGQGEADGVRLFKPETIRLMTSVQSPPAVLARRGLGWDIDSGYSRPRGLLFPLGSYGHTGFSGALLWIDPFSRTFVILLTNRLHPDGQGNVMEVYAAVGTLAARAVSDFDFRHVPQALPFRTNFIPWGAVTNLLSGSGRAK